MNDLDLLREHRPDAPLRSLSDLSSAREAVMAAIAADAQPDRLAAIPSAAAPRWRELRRGWPGPARRIAIGGVTVAAAAAITAGMLAGTAGSAHHTQTAASGHAVVPARLTAKQVLDAAAAAALRGTAVVPKPGQFIYAENKGGMPVAAVIRTWTSVDGERNGLTTSTSPDGQTHPSTIQLGCTNGKVNPSTTVPGTPKGTVYWSSPGDQNSAGSACPPEPGFFLDMPTKAREMLGYLQRTQEVRPGDVNDVASTVGEMLLSDDFLPAQRAALYEFLTTTPGITVQTGVRDNIGRLGTAVVWPGESGEKTMLVFDPETYAFLALITVGEQGQKGYLALTKIAVVNQTGQLP
jgi:hypothetical protein